MSSIGETLAKLRAKRGWTLQHLSAVSGVSVSHLSAIERGTRPNPSIQQVAKLAAAFAVPIACFQDAPGNSGPRQNPDETPAADDMANRFLQLYDAETQQFIVSEQSKPYVALAMKLAQQGNDPDASALLQVIAQFMQEQRNDKQSQE